MIRTKRVVWTVAFLSVTLAAIVMEVIAGVWHPAGTIPWTEYIATYVPWPIQLAAYVVLAVWLPFHFWRHDHARTAAYRNGLVDGHLESAITKSPIVRTPEVLARMFHEAYEELAPAYSYKTREASAVPWEDVPDQNKRLMIATSARVLQQIIRDAR